MIEIVAWALAGVLAILSTLPLFILGAGRDAARGRAGAWAVAACGFGFAAFIVYAARDQAGAFDPGQTYESANAPSQPAVKNPFTTN